MGRAVLKEKYAKYQDEMANVVKERMPSDEAIDFYSWCCFSSIYYTGAAILLAQIDRN